MCDVKKLWLVGLGRAKEGEGLSEQWLVWRIDGRKEKMEAAYIPS